MANLSAKQKRCEDCSECNAKNWTCAECFGQKVEDIDDCPLGFTFEEFEELEKKAKEVRIDHDARAEVGKGGKGKPKTVKVSDRKKHLFSNLKVFLEGYCLNNDGELTVERDNKLILVKVDGKVFKIDLIEQRQSKK